jgi:hypothetical protein
MSQLIRYSRACGSYQEFLDRGLLLTRKSEVITCGAGTALSFTAHEFIPIFSGDRVAQSLNARRYHTIITLVGVSPDGLSPRE